MDTSYFDDVIGHENIKERLRRFLAQGRLPHAMIFAGPEGLGKCLLARALASVFAKRPALVHTSNLVCDETHLTLDDGDYVFYVDVIGSMLRVSQFRELQEKLSLRADRSRLCIINHGETMNKEFANCMLKTLEEPPEGVHFVLITSQPDALLPTILSRCALLTFEPVTDDVMLQGLVKLRGGSEADYAQAVALGNGNVARVLEILSGKGLKEAEDAVAFFRVMTTHAVPYAKAQAMTAAMTDTSSQQIFSYLALLLRDLIVLREGGQRQVLCLRQYSTQLTELMPYWPDTAIFSLLSVLDEAGEALRRHVNGHLVWDYVCIRFIQAKGGTP